MNTLTNTATMAENQTKGYKGNLEFDVEENDNFRKVVYTGNQLQLVLMSLKPGEEIGIETHEEIDQFFRFESGSGTCFINESKYCIKAGDAIIVPAGSQHNVINTSTAFDLKMYTIYTPPNHQDGIVRATKKDAETIAESFDGLTTE